MSRRFPGVPRLSRASLPAVVIVVTGALALGLVLGLRSCSSAPDVPRLEVSGAYLPQPVTGEVAGGFLILTNSGAAADKLASVTSDLSDDVQLHKAVGSTMRRVSSLTVPANGTLELGRGGSHLMFTDLKRKPVEGETVSLELHFTESDPIRLQAPVEAANYAPEE